MYDDNDFCPHCGGYVGYESSSLGGPQSVSPYMSVEESCEKLRALCQRAMDDGAWVTITTRCEDDESAVQGQIVKIDGDIITLLNYHVEYTVDIGFVYEAEFKLPVPELQLPRGLKGGD